jgi:serine/threonine protein kinase
LPLVYNEPRNALVREAFLGLVAMASSDDRFSWPPSGRKVALNHKRTPGAEIVEPAKLELDDIFCAALELTSAAERHAYLDKACGDDVEVRRRVERLLAAHTQAGSFLAAKPEVVAVTRDVPGESPGLVIGDYKLLQVIGEGGMGTVWMAEQLQPVQRKVALKIIKAGMDSRAVLARFEAERQALALMDHPNIAKVLDAGATTTGRPYFVMELVKGDAITKYCDDHRLTPRQRLELFMPVCQAIQHAHQKGIIHRDIKPSNILVAPYDGKPVVKVIDFGVAKATGQRLTDKTLFTEFGAVVGTLEYMSPEQAELNNQDIDTRSDIYSLGVLLYELLTGSTPLLRGRVKQAAMLEVLRLIREEEPPRPSTRLSTTDELPSVAANRGLEPKKLSVLVRGDLDWIAMKALDKDRGRRYETANGLALDVQRFLADEPVLARPPSSTYRFRKMVRRNRSAVTLATCVLVLVLVGAAVSTWQAIRATIAERETSEALTQVTTEQAKTNDALTAARGTLDSLHDEVVETMFARQPELEEPEKEFLRKMLKHYEAVAPQLANTAEAKFLRAKGQFKVAHLLELLGDQPAGIAGYQGAATLLKQLADESPEETAYRDKLARANANLGVLLAEAGKDAEGETAFRLAITLRTKLVDEFPNVRDHRTILAKCYNDLGYVLERQGKHADAGKAYRESLDRHENLVVDAPDVPAYQQDLARARANMGDWLRKQERYAEAEKTYLQAIKAQEEQLEKSPTVARRSRMLADSYQGFGIVLAELGKEDESEKTFERSAVLRRKLVNEFPRVRVYQRELAATYNDIGYLQTRRKKFAEAEKTYQQAVDVVEKLIAESDALPAYRKLLSLNYTNLGKVFQDEKKDAEAEKAYRASLKLDLKLIKDFPNAAEHRGGAANVLVMLAGLQQGRKDFKAAAPLLAEARTHLKAALEISPKSPMARKLYRDSLRIVAKNHLSLADHARLAETGEELAGFGYEPPNDSFDAATMLAACATLASKQAGLDEAKRKELAQGYADRAMTLMRQAITRGFRNVQRMQNDPRLEPVRDRDEFRKLLGDLKAKEK